MEQENIQQAAIDEALVLITDQQFWYTIAKKKKSLSYQFQLANQQFEIGVELFREILHICPRVPNKEFVEPPPYDALVSFIKQLGYKGSLDLISELYVDHMYQPWRIFSTIIKKCLFGKVYGIDRLRQSRV
ncbi:hypothetical protein Tco_0822292 [Tanacetum coccineum]|uniref:Uncharacterized protein n=1 Tax=Tanacetum coccineum TaxID=301880 RepID=A0ABQ5AIX2_9ASTR